MTLTYIWSGFFIVGFLAALVQALGEGATLEAAIDAALAPLSKAPRNEETMAAVRDARALAARGGVSPEGLETLGDGWTGAARAVSLNVNSPQAGTKPNSARLGLMKSGANGVSLYFANADVRVETYGTAWTTLGTLSGGNAKSANWTLGYDPATSTVIVKRDRVTVWTGTYTYSGSTATAPWYAAEAGSYSTVIDNIMVWGV